MSGCLSQSSLDGGAADKGLVDGSDYNEYGVRELQGFGDVVVKLSASKTIAYRLNPGSGRVQTKSRLRIFLK